jgi:hypothetical protein
MYGDRRAAHALRAARESLAIINQFLADGDLEALWPALDRVGDALVPWPVSEFEQRDVVALAFRSSFPRLALHLADFAPTDGVYLAQLMNAGSEGVFPLWLTARTPTSYPTETQLLVDLDEFGALVLAGAPPSQHAIVAPAPFTSAQFLLADAGQLVASRISLEPSPKGDRYLAVHGPAIVAPETEALHVTGEGRLLVLVQGSETWQALERAESAVIVPGDVLYIPNGTAILRPRDVVPVDLVYAAVIPFSGQPGPEIEGGRSISTNLWKILGTSNAYPLLGTSRTYPLSTWFGSIESVSRSDEQVEGGSYTFETAWLVIPAGETVSMEHGSSSTLVLELFGPNALIERTSRTTQIVNESNHAATILVLRLRAGT